MKVVMSNPSMVALATVFSGLATLPDGTVALSIPIKANMVIVAVACKALTTLLPLLLKGLKLSALIKTNRL
jgi:hypothetical protein